MGHATATLPYRVDEVRQMRARAGGSARVIEGTVLPPAAGASAPVRLTRRGRLTVILGLMVLALLLIGVGRTAVAWAGDSGPATSTVIVQSGDTLWDIARAAQPNRDPRDTIADIRALNGLGAAAVVPGQAIVVPA